MKVYLHGRQSGVTTDLISKITNKTLIVQPTTAYQQAFRLRDGKPFVIKSIKQILCGDVNGLSFDSILVDNLEMMDRKDVLKMVEILDSDNITAYYNPKNAYLEDAFWLAKQNKSLTVQHVGQKNITDELFNLIAKHGIEFKDEYDKAMKCILTDPIISEFSIMDNSRQFLARSRYDCNINIFK